MGIPEFLIPGILEVALEESQGPEEGGQFKTHCKRESLPKAVVFGYFKYFLRGHLF